MAVNLLILNWVRKAARALKPSGRRRVRGPRPRRMSVSVTLVGWLDVRQRQCRPVSRLVGALLAVSQQRGVAVSRSAERRLGPAPALTTHLPGTAETMNPSGEVSMVAGEGVAPPASDLSQARRIRGVLSWWGSGFPEGRSGPAVSPVRQRSRTTPRPTAGAVVVQLSRGGRRSACRAAACALVQHAVLAAAVAGDPHGGNARGGWSRCLPAARQ
jgi:hypothetical protein